ncbi:putative N-acetylmannosamine-6-phosphate 2-epimerase [Phormidium sp. FACHB-592]|uniref:Putative N-acetylmannosamine-6-phosphate 2-epimerase n=1 Tax=Stenomitos frigidus AS-A4 TaxID=2933935 RepID=A0ABV0KFG4_9CYAN|nr:putative N-acetylmannosamine-6-phosphate 2-epimerase [Phormidium sp. FACHB-592]
MLSWSDSALTLVQRLQKDLIVSCQAPAESPMHHPAVIAAMAQAAINQGAVGVRLDTPTHVQAVRRQIDAPIIGLWKQQIPGFDVYITPQFVQAQAIAQAGADIIAIDATLRDRPDGETVASLIARIHHELGKPVMADVDTLEAAIAAAQAGADIVGTTLYGYTAATQHQTPPGFELLTQMISAIDVPIICEGGIASPQMARQAMDFGAYAVVVGTAITGVDLQVKAYKTAIQIGVNAGQVLAEVLAKKAVAEGDRADSLRYRFALFETEDQSYRRYINAKLDQFSESCAEVEPFFTAAARQTQKPLEILLLDEQQTILGGLIGSTSCWNWLLIDFLWVHEAHRYQGYGRQLIELAEQEAKKRGCVFARLGTFSFQARGFYEKLGYQVVAQWDDYPPGQTQYWLKKPLS